MTQAAVSYQIKLLEERVGTPLFLRAAAAGATHRHRAAAVGGGQRGVRRVARRLRQPRRGGPRRADHQRHPGLCRQLAGAAHRRLPAAPSRSRRPAVDHQPPRRLRARGGRHRPSRRHGPLAGSRRATGCSHCASRRSAARPCCSGSARCSEPADLLRLPLLTPNDPWWQPWFELAGVAAGELEIAAGHRSWTRSRSRVRRRWPARAWPCLPRRLWAADLAAGRLVQPFDLVGDDGWSFWLVYPEARRNVAKIRAWRDWLLEEVERSASEPWRMSRPLEATRDVLASALSNHGRRGSLIGSAGGTPRRAAMRVASCPRAAAACGAIRCRQPALQHGRRRPGQRHRRHAAGGRARARRSQLRPYRRPDAPSRRRGCAGCGGQPALRHRTDSELLRRLGPMTQAGSRARPRCSMAGPSSRRSAWSCTAPTTRAPITEQVTAEIAVTSDPRSWPMSPAARARAAGDAGPGLRGLGTGPARERTRTGRLVHAARRSRPVFAADPSQVWAAAYARRGVRSLSPTRLSGAGSCRRSCAPARSARRRRSAPAGPPRPPGPGPSSPPWTTPRARSPSRG